MQKQITAKPGSVTIWFSDMVELRICLFARYGHIAF